MQIKVRPEGFATLVFFFDPRFPKWNLDSCFFFFLFLVCRKLQSGWACSNLKTIQKAPSKKPLKLKKWPQEELLMPDLGIPTMVKNFPENWKIGLSEQDLVIIQPEQSLLLMLDTDIVEHVQVWMNLHNLRKIVLCVVDLWLIFSAHAYSQIDPSNIQRVFILGPSHHYRLNGCAVSDCLRYETPLYDLKVS